MKTYDEYKEIVEKALIPMLSSLGSIPEPLPEAMSYSLKAGGKRLRPVLMMAACEMAGGDFRTALPFACAIEMIHTYSLIHDDLPAMDNDDLRRGKPTSHKVFGEAIAILAGDGLLNAAAELMASSALQFENKRGLRALEIVLRHAGVTGMIAGQIADITSEGKEPRAETLQYMHEHKTADLLEAAVEAGLVLAGADEKEIEAGRLYALHLGMAFQMTDDILDVTGSTEIMGKAAGSDREQNKMTWITLRGIDHTTEDAMEEVLKAKESLKSLPWETGFFARIADDLLTRVN